MHRLWIFVFVLISSFLNYCFASQLSLPISHTKDVPRIVTDKSSKILNLTSLLKPNLYFAIKDPNTGAVSYTNNGIFIKKESYFYQDNKRLQGYTIPTELTSTDCKLMDVQTPDELMPPQATNLVTLRKINLNATDIPPTGPFNPNNPSTYNYSMTTTIVDSLGIGNYLFLYFAKSGTMNQWNINVYVNGIAVGTGIITFSSNGNLVSATGLYNLTFDPTTGASRQVFDIQLSHHSVTQTGTAYSSEPLVVDGLFPGNSVEEVVDENGYITELYTNGRAPVFSKIAVFNR